MVHACIGAYKAMSSLGDQHALGAQDADAFIQHHLDHARIGRGDQTRRDPHGVVARLDRGGVHEAPLGLRDDLLRDDEHVAC